jgi:uncharacterized repeat protein (TIGR01451 family)
MKLVKKLSRRPGIVTSVQTFALQVILRPTAQGFSAAAAAAVLCAALFAPNAGAQAAPKALNQSLPTKSDALSTQLTLKRVVQVDGADTLADASNVQPGDVLQYAMVFNNTSASTLRDVVASLPVPAGTQLLGAAVQGDAAWASVWASVDGKRFAPMPVMRKVQLPTGVWVEQQVPLAELRFVRWPARALAAGQRWQASLRVQVLAAQATALAPTAVTTATAPITTPR